MQSRNFGVGHSPIVASVFTQHYDDSIIAPGNPRFISTENLYIITTENGFGLVTEG